MMRWRAVELLGQPGPLTDAFMELGDITILVGPNDSGKTRILNSIATALQYPHRWRGGGNLNVYMTVPEAQLRAFLDPDAPDHGISGAFDAAQENEPFRSELAVPADDGDMRVGIEFPCAAPLPAWTYGMSMREMPTDLRERIVDRFGYSSDDPDSDWPWTIDFIGGLDAGILPEPVVVPSTTTEVTGAVQRSIIDLCRALRVFGERWATLVHLVGDLDNCPPATWTAPGTWEEGPPGDESPRWLLDESVEAISRHPAAWVACSVLRTIANDLLPDFVSARYELQIVPALPASGGLNAVDVFLSDRVHRKADGAGRDGDASEADREPEMLDDEDPSDEDQPQAGDEDAETLDDSGAAAPLVVDDVLWFPVSASPGGFVVWIELALREAAARVAFLAQVLDQGTMHGISSAQVPWGSELTDAAAGQIQSVGAMLALALDSVADPVSDPPERLLALYADDQAGLGESATALSWLSPGPRSRLYLVDEPEQRLHPALAREAAAWLSEVMTRWESQCIVATHSIAFMDMPGDVVLYEVVRGRDQSVLRRLAAEDVTPHTQLARAMGFDRGELMSRWNACLFVEGNADVAVINELFEEELTAARILLLAAHGHRHHAALLDVQMFSIVAGTPIAALFDNISREEIQRMQSESYRTEALRRRDESATVAQLVQIGFERGREVEILTIGSPDIFDLLDEDSVRSVMRAPSFPGHAQARNEFQARGGGNAQAYKTFLRDEYRIRADVHGLRAIARDMKREGRTCERLAELILRVESLSLSA